MNSRQSRSEDKIGADLNAQRFQMLEDISRELEREIVFPTYFDAAVCLRKELQDVDVSAARLTAVIGVEPFIAARLIRLANSSRHNPNRAPVRDISAAIGLLGIELVRTTVLSIAANQLFRAKEMACFGEQTHTLWEHSVKAAAAARLVAAMHTRIKPDEALLAGLVHDLGAFYMLYRAAQYPELRERPDTVRHLVMQWHEGIGVTLLNAMRMPKDIVRAVADHDHPRVVPETLRTLADVVYVSNILASAADFEWRFQDSDRPADSAAAIRLRFAALLPQIEADTLQMQSVFA
jgi:HD-like signal output (HDOD) protein